MTEIAGAQLLLTSLEMQDEPLWDLAKSVQGPQPSGLSRYVLLRGTQVVSEANQDAAYTGFPLHICAKKAARIFRSALYRIQVCKRQLKPFKKPLLSLLQAV